MDKEMRFENDVEQLKAFYDVSTELELIEAMSQHIERLQNKLSALRFIPPLWFVLFVCSLFVIAIIIATVAAWKNHKRNKRLFGP